MACCAERQNHSHDTSKLSLLCYTSDIEFIRSFCMYFYFFFRMAAVLIDLIPLLKSLLRMSSVGNQGLHALDPSAFTLG